MNEKYLPLLATIVVFSALFITGGILYKNFLSTLVLGDILADNAFVIIAAIGTTFVILSGGIDLSIGSMIGFVGVVMANLDVVGWHPLVSGGIMLCFGLLFGALQGLIIDFCEIQPFIVTLAGLFLLRGSCFMINLDSVPIRHPFVAWFAGLSIPLPGEGELRSSAVVMLVALAAAIVIAHFTRFGAYVYAIGGDRTSAALMGVPMRRTTVEIYALAGFYSALGGVIYALYTSSGYPLAGTGTELTAIASVVLGGTVLTGGVGMVAGTLFGGMILGLIATLINFNGSLNGAWIMISGGVLLFLFIVMQRSLLSSFRAVRGASLKLCSRFMSRVSRDLTPVAARSRAGSPHSPTERAQRRDRVAHSWERNIHTSLAGKTGTRDRGRALSAGVSSCPTRPLCARGSRRCPAPR